jgi:hypothetical protein
LTKYRMRYRDMTVSNTNNLVRCEKEAKVTERVQIMQNCGYLRKVVIL